MSAVVESIGDALGDVVEFAGDIGETVVEAAGDVVGVVSDVAQGVVQGAIDDPLGTIVKVGTAIYAPYLLPVVTAGVVVANGGDIEDALIAGGISYVTQGVTQGLETGLADTAFGEMLGEVAQYTGLESLPSAAIRGIATTGAQTTAGLLQGQDLEDALTRGLTAGVGSTIGRVAGSEIDTGSDIADRLIGRTISGGTTAALRGRDFETGAGGALASGLLDVGITEGIKGLKGLDFSEDVAETSPTETIPPMLADTGASVTDTSLSPTEEAVNRIRQGTVTVYDPATGEPVQRQDTPEEKANLAALIEALYPKSLYSETEKPIDKTAYNNDPANIESAVEQKISKIDEYGSVYDFSGALIGDAEDFGFMRGTDTSGQTAYITPSGELVGTSEAPSSSFEAQIEAIGAAPTDAFNISSLIGGGEMEGDYPEKIINNPDGSTTVIEFDGTLRIFNVDGSVTTINNGEEKVEEKIEEKPEETPDNSPINLGNLANTLLGSVTKSGSSGSRGGRGGIYGALAGLGAGIYGALEGDSNYEGFNVNPTGFRFNQGQYQAPVNAVAYGQDFISPEYYADGGLASVPQYITPTISNNGLTFKQPQDPTASVYMYAQGGLSSLGYYSDGGRMLKGPGDGMSDDIPATIANKQPARLANEEFVIPADVVSHLGNGSSEAGAKVLYEMMARVRKARTGNTRQGKQIKPTKYLPK